ncbi:hypothetical protein [Microvirga sp. VF16]|uniref:hypothetical protein n=1 Tax=Microvirga sp. VF16 TaxID=2807101 RepID=UPI00193CF9D0|nr:hypothetical protein [Microvirga sp. VF16]QRM36135.1 hypothetical protein JO965_46145 [Microvirga sp. VF16]
MVHGKTRMRGMIEAILPLSAVIEGRQSSLLQPAQATLVARVRLDANAQPPALNSAVRVHMYYTEVADRFFKTVVGILGLD